MRLYLNGQELLIATVSDLYYHLDRVGLQQFSEIWLFTDDKGPSLSMLVNRESAWLMYLCTRDDDSGFSSRNSLSTDSAEATMEFRLNNGQIDAYPVSWTLPLKEAFSTFEYFLIHHGERSPFINWHDDSREI